MNDRAALMLFNFKYIKDLVEYDLPCCAFASLLVFPLYAPFLVQDEQLLYDTIQLAFHMQQLYYNDYIDSDKYAKNVSSRAAAHKEYKAFLTKELLKEIMVTTLSTLYIM